MGVSLAGYEQLMSWSQTLKAGYRWVMDMLQAAYGWVTDLTGKLQAHSNH